MSFDDVNNIDAFMSYCSFNDTDRKTSINILDSRYTDIYDINQQIYIAYVRKEDVRNHRLVCRCLTIETSRCSRCRILRYCSSECQREHYPIHKNKCKLKY